MSQLEQYFYNGQFHQCLKEARKTPEEPISAHFIALFEKFQLDQIPTSTEHFEQSVERSNETYAEQDEVERIRTIEDEATFQQKIVQLEQLAREGTNEQKAQSFLTQGFLFLYAHHYDESVHCFMEAVKYAPNKAVYYGITAQTMQRFNWSPFEVMGYLERAIELDKQNARWYWIKALMLIQLYKDLQKELFLENAIVALEEAKRFCREEQKSLLNAVDNTFETIRDLLMN